MVHAGFMRLLSQYELAESSVDHDTTYPQWWKLLLMRKKWKVECLIAICKESAYSEGVEYPGGITSDHPVIKITNDRGHAYLDPKPSYEEKTRYTKFCAIVYMRDKRMLGFRSSRAAVKNVLRAKFFILVTTVKRMRYEWYKKAKEDFNQNHAANKLGP